MIEAVSSSETVGSESVTQSKSEAYTALVSTCAEATAPSDSACSTAEESTFFASQIFFTTEPALMTEKSSSLIMTGGSFSPSGSIFLCKPSETMNASTPQCVRIYSTSTAEKSGCSGTAM